MTTRLERELEEIVGVDMRVREYLVARYECRYPVFRCETKDCSEIGVPAWNIYRNGTIYMSGFLCDDCATRYGVQEGYFDTLEDLR